MADLSEITWIVDRLKGGQYHHSDLGRGMELSQNVSSILITLFGFHIGDRASKET